MSKHEKKDQEHRTVTVILTAQFNMRLFIQN